MFCRKCGKELNEGSRFCIYCGAKQGGEDPPVPMPIPNQTIPGVELKYTDHLLLSQEAEKKGKNPGEIGLILLISLLIAVGVFLLFLIIKMFV